MAAFLDSLFLIEASDESDSSVEEVEEVDYEEAEEDNDFTTPKVSFPYEISLTNTPLSLFLFFSFFYHLINDAYVFTIATAKLQV